MKKTFQVNGFWAFMGLLLLVVLIWDFLQKPNGGLGIAKTVGGFFQNVVGIAAGKQPTATL